MHRAKHPTKKTVLLVTDFPIQNEVDNDMAWSGASHLSLLSDLAKVGISQRDIHTTYLSYDRQDKDSYDWGTELKKKRTTPENEGWELIPHQKDLYYSPKLKGQVEGLLGEIVKVEPKVIIIAGKWSYFFLTGLATQAQTQNSGSSQKPMGGLAKHRASLEPLHSCWELSETLVFPILPAVTKQRSPDKIPVMKWDYAKVGDIYKELVEGTPVSSYLEQDVEHIIGTDYSIVCNWFNVLLFKLAKGEVLVSVDIETRYSSTIDCIGFAYEEKTGLCIPFSTLAHPNFWDEDEEVVIYRLMARVLGHKNCKVTGQNYSYDSAFIRKFWLIESNAEVDTMILHHVLYNSMQKDLAFLASVYCRQYRYWKDMQHF
jgi:hypothetical protein